MAKVEKTGAGITDSGRQLVGTTRLLEQLADSQLAEHQGKQPVPPPADAEGWRAWKGGVMPVAAVSMVEVQLRGGFLMKDGKPLRASAARFDWKRTRKADDVVAFRIVEI